MRQAPIVTKYKIPTNWSDDALIPIVYGHYGKPLPDNYDSLRLETIDRGKDYINCRTSIDNNNIEMNAIRQLND